MKIKSLLIKNYRQLDNTSFLFNDTSNYLVGKNNIGKTSTLKLIEILLTGKNFQLKDFNDPTRPIKIKMKLKISEDETGIFEDNFSPENANEIVIDFSQEDPDSPLIAKHSDTDSDIRTYSLKQSNYIAYSSNIRPIRENDLVEEYGSYKLIPEIVNYYISNHDGLTLEKTTNDDDLIYFVNEELKKIKPFKESNVSVDFSDNYKEFVDKALILKDKKGIGFSKLGFGIQFSSLIPLIIIDKIIQWKRYKKIDNHLIVNSENEKCLHIILSVDEPEVHLHPNLQLKLINYIRKLLNGKDSDFNSLIKDLFGIDKIVGQLFVVTHSPSILPNDYRKLSRLTVKDGKVIVASGESLHLDTQEEKQLNRLLPYVASALFADNVILVEGDTEESALKVFAKKLNIDLVDNNTNIIKADGIKNIFPLAKLFNEFKINNVSIIDSDGKSYKQIIDDNLKGKEKNKPENLYITTKKDFEYEAYAAMNLVNINKYLHDFEEQINNNIYNGSFWFKYLDKDSILSASDKTDEISKQLNSLSEDEKTKIKSEIKKKLMAKNCFFKKKSILNGKIIAENIDKVPDVYKKAIRKAVN